MFENHKIVIKFILFLVFLILIIVITTTFAQASKVVDFLQQQKPLLENNPRELVSNATITQPHDGGYDYVKYV
jgi:hypothetical protein